MKRIDAAGRDVTGLDGLQDDDTDRFVTDEEYLAGCKICLRIYRDAAKPVDISGFATVQQAIEYGNEWTPRLWWRVKQNGVVVAEEPKEVKR
jgi:hypothetical protein